MKGCSEWYRSNWRKTGLGLVWVSVGLITPYRDSPAVQTVFLPIMARPLAKEAQGHCLKDYRYYRCTGSDGYRFGGERICSNGQIRAEFLEDAVWREVCDLLRNPEKLERQFKEGGEAVASLQNAEALKVRRLKQQHALERLIDSFTEGLIEKDQFTSRMARTKGRIAELDTQIQAYSGDISQQEQARLAAERIRQLAATIGPDLAGADWHRRRDVIRTLVQKVEIGRENVKIVFRLDAARSGLEPIAVTLPR